MLAGVGLVLADQLQKPRPLGERVLPRRRGIDMLEHILHLLHQETMPIVFAGGSSMLGARIRLDRTRRLAFHIVAQALDGIGMRFALEVVISRNVIRHKSRRFGRP